jgi:alpha-glucosidase
MKKFLFFFLFLFFAIWCHSKEYKLQSPDKSIEILVNVSDKISWSAQSKGIPLFSQSVADLQVDGVAFGISAKVASAKASSFSGVATAVVPLKSREIPENYNQLRITLKSGNAIVFRAYDNGFAYRWETSLKGMVKVENEIVDLNFAGNFGILFPEEESMVSHYERLYLDTTISNLNEGSFCSLPFLVKAEKNIKIGITETDLFDYPNLFIEATGSQKMKSKFPPVVLETRPSQRGADRNLDIVKEAPYIAETQGTRTFPWRIFMLSHNDAQLLENQLPFLLARPLELTDTDWIEPGLVAWDWWNDNNIYGIDFEAGLNTETYMYYIDFASEHNVPYIILDEGWSKSTTNVLEPNERIDMVKLMQYGASKNVDIILWTLWGPLHHDMENILNRFQEWGAKGIKVDFMQRADQGMVNFYERAARECAKREMLINYHGAFKPAGIRRALPNVVNYEGVRGLENSKWSDDITPDHCVTLPFTRMLAGPLDFTPGAMINANKRNFTISFSTPKSQGTRCHQIAMYVIYEAPLQMMADNPSNYYREAESASFISRIPTVWDETKGIDGKVGEYVLMARKKSENWYIGAMTNWDSRTLELDLSFLDQGEYSIEIMQDGINANRAANDYKRQVKTVTAGDKIKIKMASGGGWAAICTKIK